MHRYGIIAQISLILSILNLVLAAPIVVQEMHEARRVETVVAKDLAAMPKQWHELKAASDRPKSPRSPPTSDEMASPQPSDGSTSSGYPTSSASDSPDSSHAWILDRPPHLSLNPPAPLDDSASPHHSSLGSSEMLEIPPPEGLQGFAPAPERPLSPPLPVLQRPVSPLASPRPSSSGLQGFALAPERPPPPPLPVLQRPSSPLESPRPSSSGSSEITAMPIPEELQASSIPPSPGSERKTTETSGYSPPDQYTPSRHPLPSTGSYPDESLSSPYNLASDGSVPSRHSTPDGLAPSNHLTSDGSPSSAPSPPNETPSDNAKFFNMDVMKKILNSWFRY